MAETQQGRRGSYAKGVAKREEILERALEVIAREGYRGASVKVLADAVGLSQAGLLHYFDSKEELFTEIVRKRDEVDMATYGPAMRGQRRAGPAARRLRRRSSATTADVPGLVAALLADVGRRGRSPASGPPLLRRPRREPARPVRDELARRAAAGEITDRVDPETLARIFQAVADGLQLQWMLEPDVDMAGIVAQLFDLLSQPATDRITDDHSN